MENIKWTHLTYYHSTNPIVLSQTTFQVDCATKCYLSLLGYQNLLNQWMCSRDVLTNTAVYCDTALVLIYGRISKKRQWDWSTLQTSHDSRPSLMMMMMMMMMIYSNLRTSLICCILQGTWEVSHVTCKVVYGGCNVVNLMLFYYIFVSFNIRALFLRTPSLVGVIDGYAERVAAWMRCFRLEMRTHNVGEGPPENRNSPIFVKHKYTDRESTE